VDKRNVAVCGAHAIRVSVDPDYGFVLLHNRRVVEYDSAVALSHPLPDPVVELIARRFRLLGEPVRIKLLERLREDEATVGELAQATGTSQQNVSKHLQVLLQGGVVARRKQGTSVYFSIADQAVFALCEQVCGSIEAQLVELGDLLAASRG
jgi:DNA-binding transcriptional ArsR family regulator